MRPALLASRVPTPTGDALADIAAITTAMHDILLAMDDLPPLYKARGNILVGNRPLAEDAKRGFLYIPAIDGSGAPTGTPTDFKAGDPIVRTRDDNKLWAYDFTAAEWVEIPTGDDDQEILELLLMVLNELETHRKLGL